MSDTPPRLDGGAPETPVRPRLHFWPLSSRPFRWLPKHGDPGCVAEWLSQATVKTLAKGIVFLMVVTVATLVLQILALTR